MRAEAEEEAGKMVDDICPKRFDALAVTVRYLDALIHLSAVCKEMRLLILYLEQLT